MSSDPLREMRLGDLVTLLAVLRGDSISSAARELGVTPSQVSKAIARLELSWRVRLLARTSRGVSLSEAGRRVLPHVEDAIAQLRLSFGTTQRPHLTVAGPSSLIEAFLPELAASSPEVRLRGLVLPPQLLRANAGANLFDATLLTADVDRLPTSWVSEPLGDLRQALFATPALARSLGPEPVPPAKLRAVPFVVPIYNSEGRFVAVEDDCPLPFRDRVVGHEAQTLGLALALAARTDQLVFGPVVAAREYVDAKRLVEVRVQGWNTRDVLYFACNGDRVLSRTQRAMVKTLRAALSAIDPRGASDPPSSRRGAPPSRR